MVFALVPKNMNNPFFDQARDGCKKAEKESGGKIECRYIGPGEHGGGDEQVKVVQDLITAKVNGIAVSPSNAPAMAKVLERAKAAGIPVTTWDSDLLPKDKALRVTYVGTKNYDIGVNLAKIVMQLKPKGGTICIQSGGAAAANHNERMQGIRDTISGKKSKEPPGDRLTGQNGWKEVDGCPLYTNDDFPLAATQMGEILAKYPDLTAFVPTGGFPQFVPNAYKQVVEKNLDRIKSHKTVLVVADTLPMQMELLEAGLQPGPGRPASLRHGLQVDVRADGRGEQEEGSRSDLHRARRLHAGESGDLHRQVDRQHRSYPKGCRARARRPFLFQLEDGPPRRQESRKRPG